MSNYHPDCWVIIQVPSEPKHYRVLAGWSGGYCQGDSWKISSGVVDIIHHKDYYDIINTSGSVYTCNKQSERMNLYTQSVFNTYKTQLPELEVVDFDQINPALFLSKEK